MSYFDRYKKGTHENPNERIRTPAFTENRKGSDWIIKLTNIFGIIPWAVVIAVWMVLDFAAPYQATFFSNLARNRSGIEINVEYWDEALLPVAFFMLLISLAFCLAAFILNTFRMRRKTDRYRRSVMVIGGITVIAIAAFVIKFWL